MWKTHVFRRALGPLLQQIDPEYTIPEAEQQDGTEPMTSNGEPFHFLPTAPDVLFCKGSPPMKKVIMNVQPDSPQSASKRRQTSGSAAPESQLRKGRPSHDKSSRRQHNLPQIDQNPIPTRTQLKTSLALEAHQNREPPLMKSILEQLKSKNSENHPSSQQKFAVKKLQQPMSLLLPQLSRSHSDRPSLLPHNR